MNRSEARLSGWGNCPRQVCRVQRPARPEQLRRAVLAGAEPDYVARGCGRAYGDASLNEQRGVLDLTAQNRFLEFDPQRGRLRCQAGTTLDEILATFLPRGWFLPVTPGTRFVSVGGAIAADVHGKNHHRDGSFGSFVERLELLTADGRVVVCGPQQERPVFLATLGGMGLTGIILSADLRLRRIDTAYVDVRYERAEHVEQALDCLDQSEDAAQYSVAWIDCLATGARLGRSVVMLGNPAARDQLPTSLRERALDLSAPAPRTAPRFVPEWALNRHSVRAFNAAYYAAHRPGRRLVDRYRFHYPLDAMRHWNRIYGRRGFVQYQALFPRETSCRGLVELLTAVAQSGRASFLAVLKSCGPAGDGILSYLHEGHTLALDIPYRGSATQRLVSELDQILLRHGGRIYLAKDALSDARTVAAMYPRKAEFLRIKRELDPANRFASSLSRRLELHDRSLTVPVTRRTSTGRPAIGRSHAA